MDRSADIAIVGAGIVGLAHAYMALRKGYKVVLFERDQVAVGASVRNFGLLWPIGQEPGAGLDRALRSRKHWMEVASEAGFWASNNGSLHVVYHDDEMEVLHEFLDLYKDSGFQCRMLTAEQVQKISPHVNANALKGGLQSDTEGTVYPREAVRRIPLWLEEKYGLTLRFGHVVKDISLPTVATAEEVWHVGHVFVCSGSDFETLYPEVFKSQSVTKCKLQMMKAVPEKPFVLGPSLCAGLTLRHYPAFSKCTALKKVDERYDHQLMEYKKHGIHVLVAQNQYGELIIGDSHHYGLTVEPFNIEEIDSIILDYLKSFLDIGRFKITERWNGVYPKVYGNTNLVVAPEKGVTIVNGLGGAGMTLSFGLAEEIIEKL
jgi:D-hydroxyproline dehydrogenase subunit beta